MCSFILFLGLSVLAANVSASTSYPSKPTDLTTPVQQRIAVNGPNGELVGIKIYYRELIFKHLSHFSCLEHLQTSEPALCPVWYL